MAERLSPALRAVSDAVLAVASRRSVEEVLQQLVHCARDLAGARYAALGVPDGAGGFSAFLVSGMSDDLVASLGPLPRTHGMLGAMLASAEPFRTTDIHDDPRFRGWWPRGHPDMRSFLGVPIVAPEEGVIGAFYLTQKEGAAGCCAGCRRAARSTSTSAPRPATARSTSGASARCCASRRRRCRTRCATRARATSPCGCATGCSRSPTTAPASTRPTPRCAPAA